MSEQRVITICHFTFGLLLFQAGVSTRTNFDRFAGIAHHHKDSVDLIIPKLKNTVTN